ncbi:vWA domain-containing protein [Desulfallas thermosapovorans]|uniref:VWA domain containing CoxE-like protein n=1 Tax=Desulfallas thermosapovorans DSM 6562 TaxID=1121431 RepID=A0A5S4ZQG3_9FIRM|nr:VWA domain-containing protein [Desulfallas thermosapovorans]TYO95003.1 hypothetical protein LX24_02020 [Desulfallas thermosapovorans DSM 6562]
MHASIINLVNLLRGAGLRISPGEILDFCRALQIIELYGGDALTAAQCTLAKDKLSVDSLKAVINDYLQNTSKDNHLIIPPPIDAEKVLTNPPQLSDEDFIHRLHNIKNSIRHEIMLINEAGITGGSGAGKSGAGLNSGYEYNTAFNNRNNDNNDLTCDGQAIKPGIHRSGRQYKPVSPQEAYQNRNTSPGPTNLQQLDLAKADAEQLAEINKIITAIGNRLAAHKGYRKKPAPTGIVDMRRTIRQAAARGGIPVVLKKMKPVPGKPRITVMCDLSGSMAPYSLFFLQLLVSLQHRFSKLKSYAFVDHIADVTNMAGSISTAWNIAARIILREARISRTGFSNYGQVWEQFAKDFIYTLTPQTILIIMGDARNNWQPDGKEYLSCITARCRKTIWLNPLPRDHWSINDCIMESYAPCCSLVLECRNAMQLSRAMQEIFLSIH